MTETNQTASQAPGALLSKLAEEHFFIDTLETRNRDCLDFHEVSVWGVKSALEAAYAAGQAAAKQEAK